MTSYHDVRALVTRHASLPREGTPRLVIGVVGVPGSGKTTLAASLVAAVDAAAGEAGAGVALSMDGFHLTRAQLRALPDAASALARRGSPWTFAPAALAAHIAAVRAGCATTPWPTFDHAVGDPVEGGVVVPPLPLARVVVIEGLYLLHDAHGWGAVGAALFGAPVFFLDTPPEVASARLCARHQAAWGISRDEALSRIASNDALNAEIVLATRARAEGLVAGE